MLYFTLQVVTALKEQECIPVGCVPPAAVAICWGGLPQCMLGYPAPVWAWRHPQVLALRPPLPSQTPQFPLGVGLETPQARPLNFPPGCGLGYHSPGDLQGMLGYHLQCMLGYHPPVNRITHTCKNITLPQLRCGR